MRLQSFEMNGWLALGTWVELERIALSMSLSVFRGGDEIKNFNAQSSKQLHGSNVVM
eukprot:m.105232 g.105232  ORF g.105232 m.105232 type:complete len:57 (-) comp22481_c0_seq3:194-364(-)